MASWSACPSVRARGRAHRTKLPLLLPLVAAVLYVHPAAGQIGHDLWVTNGVVNAVAVSNDVVYIGGVFNRLALPTGSYLGLDAATGGIVAPNPSVVGLVYASISDGSGGRYIGGNFSYVQGQAHSNLAHLDAAGNVTAWNPGPIGGDVLAIARDSSNPGVLYVSGYFSQVNGAQRSGLAALDVATGAVTAWAPSAAGVLALFARNGVIYVGGSFNTVAGQTRNRLAALDAAGTLLSWNPDVNGVIYTIAPFVSPLNGALTLYVGGQFTSIGGQARYSIAAVGGSSGAPTSWSPNGDHAVEAIALALDRRGFLASVYAGGTFDQIGAQPRLHLAQLNASTGAATAWDPAPDGVVKSLVFDGSTVYVGGAFGSIGGAPRRFLAAVDPATGAATAWNPDPNNVVRTVDVVGGAVFAGGDFTSLGGVQRSNVAALDIASGQPTSWNPGRRARRRAAAERKYRLLGRGVCVGGRCFAVSTGGRRWQRLAVAVGTKPRRSGEGAGGVRQHHLRGRRVPLDRGTDPAVPRGARCRERSGDQLVSIGRWTGRGADCQWRVAVRGRALRIDGRRVAHGDRGLPDRLVVRHQLVSIGWWGPLRLTADLRHCADRLHGDSGGDFQTMTGLPRRALAEVDAGTAQATAWDPSTNARVLALLASGTTLYVGGQFTYLGGVSRTCLAAVELPTRSVSDWNPSVTGSIYALALMGGALFEGGAGLGAGGWPHASDAELVASLTAVAEGPSVAAAASLQLSANPSWGRVSFGLRLPNATTAEVGIYDVSGRLVRRVHAGALPAGELQFSWDGRDDAGRLVSAGTYFVRVRGEGLDLASKLLRMR